MPSFKSYDAYIEHRYVNGGGLASDANAMLYHAERMLDKAKIIRHIDKVIALKELYNKLNPNLTNNNHVDIDFHDTIVIHTTLSSYYEPVADDVFMLSAFEMYAKAILLKKQYIIHKINGEKKIHRQDKAPVHFKTYRKLLNTEQINGIILNQTVTAATLLSPSYTKKIGISRNHASYINQIKDTRNKLHFMGIGFAYGMDMQWLKAIRWLKSQIKAN